MASIVGLVEDDDVIRENLSDYLEARGFRVEAFGDRLSAQASFSARSPDVAVLDVALGDERDGGFRLCREIRKHSKTLPIIFLTCHDAELDRISGLRMGADDYLSKESSLEFLAVRIETLLQRRQAYCEADRSSGEKITSGSLFLDLQSSTLSWKGVEVVLPLTQFWMVVELASAPAIAKSAEDLMRAANIRVAPNTVAAHIRSIRKRLEAVDPGFNAIRTERGLGYRWCP